jgi:hypothetical protein
MTGGLLAPLTLLSLKRLAASAAGSGAAGGSVNVIQPRQQLPKEGDLSDLLREFVAWPTRIR